MSDENKVEVAFGASTSGIDAGAKQAVDSVKSAVSEIKSQFETLKGAADGIKGAFALVATALAGGELFKDAVKSTIQLSGEVTNLSKKLGISREEASVLDVALKHVGASAEDYIGVVTHLNRQLKTNEDGLRAIGLETRKANGDYKNQKEIVDDALAALMEYKEGTDRNLASQAMFGRGADEVTKVLKANKEVMAESKELAEAFGLIMGQDTADGAKKMRSALATVNTAAEAIDIAIGKAVIPGLANMADMIKTNAKPIMEGMGAVIDGVTESIAMMGDVTSQAMGVIKDIIGAVGDVIKSVFGQSSEPMTGMQFFKNVLAVLRASALVFKEVIQFAFELIRIAIVVLVGHFKILADVAYAAFHLDWEGVKSAWTNGFAAIDKMVDDSSKRFRDKAIENGKAIQEALLGKDSSDYSNEGRNHPVKSKTGTKNFTGKDKEEKSKLGDLEERLTALKVEYMKEHEFREMSKDDEQAYWKNILATVTLNSKDKTSVKKKMEQAELDSMKEAFKWQQGTDKETLEFGKKVAEDKINNKRQELQAKFDLGEINNSELLAQQMDLEKQLYDIQVAYQNAAIEMLKHGPKDPVAMKAANDRLVELELEYQTKIHKIHDDQQKEDQKASINFGQSLQSDMSTGFQTLLTKWQYLSVTIKSMFQSIYQSFMKTMIADPLAELAVAFVKQTAMWKAFSTWKISMFGVEAGSSAAAKKAEAVATIPADAAMAAGEAASAVAGIPIVGPALAAAAFAETMAMVMGGLAVASSAGGEWQVPQDRLNIVHKDETILPAREAQGLRDMVEGGGSGGGMHVTIHAVDAASVRRLFMENGSALAAAIGQQRRNFNGNLR